ncbi:hypothetical protein KKF91_12350 [Myxococcota bacterium]|nr:hypothetical protein [Myxococcota bacterium]MBU1431323.1 hypothetical protein [Myxococcota bacterium]MBU1896452.1 hypothetical protein [Myxococcota bacterium]
MSKLNQILAIEKGVKTRVYGAFTKLHQTTQKAHMMNGFSKTYKPNDEDGEAYPPESQKVQYEYRGVLKEVTKLLSELFDVTATKDWANQSTCADIIIGDQVLLKDVPPTYLLFLEKQLSDLHTFITKMSEVDPSEDWIEDPNSNLLKTEARLTHRTKKVQRPVVLYPATAEHPAQTQLISEDVVVGFWHTIKFTGALPLPKKQLILERIERLSKAVKFAREQANGVEVTQKKVGEALLSYLFGL